MKRKKGLSAATVLKNIIELYLPTASFIILFAAFLIGVIARYCFKNPQSWTFEVSSICYLAVGILSWGLAHREDDHIVFDMVYTNVSPCAQCVMRIVSNICIAVTAGLLIVPSINYLESMMGLKSQIIKIPRFVIFLPFTISFVSAVLRSGYRAVLDIRAFIKKEYIQTYGKKVTQ